MCCSSLVLILVFINLAATSSSYSRLMCLCVIRQDLSRSSLAELLLSDLLQVENEALEEANFPLTEGEPEDIHVDLERAAGAGPLLAPRERKAGCKNFFWKTFTSC